MLEPTPDGPDNDVRVELDINGTTVTTVSFHSTESRAWQEIIEANLLKEKGNKLTVTLTNADKKGSLVLRTPSCTTPLLERSACGAREAPSRLARPRLRVDDRRFPVE